MQDPINKIVSVLSIIEKGKIRQLVIFMRRHKKLMIVLLTTLLK